MARNEEKNYTILNRLYLENQAKLTKDKNPERPHLNSLSTGAEVKKWIPGIKWEINFCLHHLSGIRNYPDYKIREFQERLEDLQKEYKRWVKRALELDPDTPGIPGDPHVYVSKKTISDIKERKQIARQMNPNGYTKLYTKSINLFRLPKQDEPEVHYDEEGYANEEEEIEYSRAVAGAEGVESLNQAPFDPLIVGQVHQYHQQLKNYYYPPAPDPDAIQTPLAVRPDGYVSEEEEEKKKEPAAVATLDLNDPQNQPLAFSKKRKEEYSYQYTAKRPNTTSQEGGTLNNNINNNNINIKPQEKEKPTGLLGLAAYGDSDDE